MGYREALMQLDATHMCEPVLSSQRALRGWMLQKPKLIGLPASGLKHKMPMGPTCSHSASWRPPPCTGLAAQGVQAQARRGRAL